MSAAEQESGEDVGSCFDQIKNFVTASKLNVLYVFVPISIVLGNTNLNPTLTFVCAFFGLIPLAQALGDLTEDIAKRTNAATAALINVTFGNATEVIVSITALRLGQLDIIRYSLVGSVIGNMLLVAGSALVVAGVKYPIMEFNVHATNSFVTMLILSSFCYVLPSTFNTIATQNTVDPSLTLSFSRQISVVMIVLYAAYMYFQHRSHAHLFDGSAEEEEEALDVPSPAGETNAAGDVEMTAVAAPAASESIEHSKSAVVPTATLPPTVAVSRSAVVEPPPAVVTVDIGEGDDDDDDDDDPEYSFLFAVVMTGVVAVLISILSDYLVASLDDAAQSLKLSRHFVGLVIVAIVGNVAEHAGAIMMAYRNKMDIALSIAFGSSVQIGMFVMPLICVFGIFFDQPLDLAVTPFLIASIFASVVLLLSIVNLGCATWLGGMQLLAAWALFALAFINAPD